MFVLAIVLLITALVLLLVGRGQTTAGWKLGAALSAVAGVLAGAFACVHVVSAAEVGVPVTFGRIGTPLMSGMHFKSPFTDVTAFSTRPVDLNLNDKNTVEVRSSQGGLLYADVTIKWAVVPAEAVELYRLAGSEEAVEERLVLPDSREIIRNVFAQHTSEEGYASAREEIGAEIADLVKERLAPRGIDVTSVNLRNVKPSKELQEQIDKKIQQEQATERATEASRTAEAEAERRRPTRCTRCRAVPTRTARRSSWTAPRTEPPQAESDCWCDGPGGAPHVGTGVMAVSVITRHVRLRLDQAETARSALSPADRDRYIDITIEETLNAAQSPASGQN